jgi:two-component system, NtrC family, sensor histidine kinase HydH
MLDQARQPSVREKTDLALVLERTCELARPRLARTAVTIQVSMPEALLIVEVDRVQFELALLNLIVNAVDAMPEGGTITIHAATALGGVQLEIADTGSGIPAGVLDRVFEPWVTTKPVGQGTGLGLSIVRDVVQTHGGRVSARNGPSGGAVFVIELPLAASPRPV